MKPKEALIHFEEHLCKHCCEWNKSLRHCNTCPTDAAKKALEKQIPKKPIKSDREIRYCEVWKCPSCGFEWSSRVVDYCYRCGQRIDWQEIEWGDENEES